MGKRVTVEEGESIDRALMRLRHLQSYEYKRWTKKRYGYFEKPSALRRKKRKMAEIWQLNNNQLKAGGLKIGGLNRRLKRIRLKPVVCTTAKRPSGGLKPPYGNQVWSTRRQF